MVSARSPLESSPSSSAPTIRWPTSTGRPTPSYWRRTRSERSRSSDRAPGPSLLGKVCSATSSPSRDRAHRTDPSAAAAAVTAGGSGPPARAGWLSKPARSGSERGRRSRGTVESAPRRPRRERVGRQGGLNRPETPAWPESEASVALADAPGWCAAGTAHKARATASWKAAGDELVLAVLLAVTGRGSSVVRRRRRCAGASDVVVGAGAIAP